MNSTIGNKIEATMFNLYQVLASQLKVQLSENYTQETNKYSTIIVFQRYISETKTIFLYCYDSNSLIILRQQHYKLDEFIPQYLIIVQAFLQQILIQKKQGVCINFINYAFELDNIEIKQEAYKLLEVPFPQSKIILCMEYNKTLQYPDDYLQIQIPFNQFALLKFQQDLIINKFKYEQFTKEKITQILEIHEQFKQKLEQCEQQIVELNFLSLIKAITIIQDIPDSIQHLAQLLMNLSSYARQDTFIIITILRLYKQNAILRKSVNQQKLKINEYMQIAQTDLSKFKEIKNQHFPKKGENSQKCKVCQKNSDKVRKSSFVCEACQIYYKINVSLCTTKCFKLFHLNPEKYLYRKNRTQKTKVEV